MSERFGFGRQTFMTHVEELLEEENLTAEDLGLSSTRELLELLDDFVTILDFKGGRSYVRINQLPEWDKSLAASEGADKAKKTSGQNGKPWKKSRQVKSVRPVKPRRVRKQKQTGEQAEGGQPQAGAAPEPNETPAATPEVATAQEGAPSPAGEPEEKAESRSEGVREPMTAAVVEESTQRDATDEGDGSSVAPLLHEDRSPSPMPHDAADASGSASASIEEARLSEDEATEPTVDRDAGADASADASVDSGQPEGEGSEAALASGVEPDTGTEAEGEHAGFSPVAEADGTSGSAGEAGPADAAGPTDASVDVTRASERPAADLRGIPTSFSDEVHCPTALAATLARVLPFDVWLDKVLDEDWAYAVSTGSVRGTRTEVTFPLRYLHADGTPIEVTIRHSPRAHSGKLWEVVDVDGSSGEDDVLGCASAEPEGAWEELLPPRHDFDQPVSCLREFAATIAIPSWDVLLEDVASVAAPEDWGVPPRGDQGDKDDKDNLLLLKEYLCDTFHRIMRQGKLTESSDGSRAALDTGLRDVRGLDVLLVLRRTIPEEAPGVSAPWTLDSVVSADPLSHALPEQLGDFDVLPAPATYVESLEDVRPAPDALVDLDCRGIALHEMDRLPRPFLETEFSDFPEASALLAKDDLDGLGHLVSKDEKLLGTLGSSLSSSLARSLRAAALGFRPGAPAYNAATDKVELLLPVCLAGDAIDRCVALRPSGPDSYEASSVVSLACARVCARTACPHLPLWLS